MKKGVIALLIILALVVLVSPGIVGRMAESSIDNQIQWGASEAPEIVVTTERFDRGWFSSEGVHRIELGQTGPGASMREALGIGPSAPSPALVINTTFDHGLIPVTSVTREEGSLMPGLARAVSTMSVEIPGGETWEIPGVVYTNVGLGGGMSSNYYVEAGSYEDFSWGAGDLMVATNPSSGNIVVEGGIDTVSFGDENSNESVSLSMLEIESDTETTDYGFSTGDIRFSVDSITIVEGFQTISMGPMNVEGSTRLNGDRVDSDVTMDMTMAGAPLGDMSWNIDMALEGWDAAAFGRVTAALESAQNDPFGAFAAVERDFADLVAAGLAFRVDRFDVNLPQGTLLAELEVDVPESDAANFVWTSVLLEMEAAADITISAGLFDMIAVMNPDAQMAVAMGVLRQEGDNYVMEAEYKQGLLTVNGAPMPIPLPGM